MKKHLYLFLLFISGGILFGQSTYISFPDSNARWNEQHVYGGAYPCIQVRDLEIFIEKDTLINTHTYKKLGCHEHFYINAYPGCFNTTQYYSDWFFGYYRNDTAAKKVFILQNNIDTLLYDFSKTTSDTVQTAFGPYVIDSVTTMIYGNINRNVQYANWYLESGSAAAHVRIIEGIGSDQGLFPSPWNWEGMDELQCFSQEDQKIYPDTNGVCQHINSLPVHQRNEVKLFPNPVTNMLTVSGFELKGNLTVKMYDFTGKPVKESHPGSTTIYVSDLGAGIYFVEISNQSSRFKIVIAR